MMKPFCTKNLLIMFISMMGVNTFAQDIIVKNADGIAICYNYVNDGKELEVTFHYWDKYYGDVVIPEEVTYMNRTRKVTSIGYRAFYDCSGLNSVTIPTSATSIGNEAFQYCSGLTSVNISDIAAWCNIKFYDDKSNPLRYAHHLYMNGEEVSDLVIPNSVTSISNYAFQRCYYLTSVTIPNSVTSISGGAFSDCSGLTSVIIPNSVTSIGGGAFSGCSGLTSIRVENDNPNYDSRNDCNAVIETTSNTLIVGCKNTIIPNSVSSIRNAFSGCTGLTSVTIPNSVTSIGYEAFRGCSGLTSVTIPNSVTSIGTSGFRDCSGLTSVTIPNSVTSIGYEAFRGCSGLTSVTIPNSVTSIGTSGFEECYGLTSVTIPHSVTSIGDKAFASCSGLTSVTIGNSVTSIGRWAFDGANIQIVVSMIENPFKIAGKISDERTFNQNTFNNATLYVPIGTIDKYKAIVGWQDFVFIEEGTGNSIASVRAQVVLIQSNGSMLDISGVDAGTIISVYDTIGTLVGSAKASASTTAISTTLQSGEIGIVKIGDKAIKVVVR